MPMFDSTNPDFTLLSARGYNFTVLQTGGSGGVMLPMTHAKRPAPLAPPAAARATVTVTTGAPPGPTSVPPPTAAASASLSTGRPRAGLGRRPKILVVSPLSVGRMTLPVHEPEPASGLEAKAQQPSPATPQPGADHPWQQRAQLERHHRDSQCHLTRRGDGNASESWVPRRRAAGPLAVVESLCAADWHSASSRNRQRHATDSEGITVVMKPNGSYVAESPIKCLSSGCWRTELNLKLLGWPLTGNTTGTGSVRLPGTDSDSEAPMQFPLQLEVGLQVSQADAGRTNIHDGSVPEPVPPGPSGRPILMSFVGESRAFSASGSTGLYFFFNIESCHG